MHGLGGLRRDLRQQRPAHQRPTRLARGVQLATTRRLPQPQAPCASGISIHQRGSMPNLLRSSSKRVPTGSSETHTPARAAQRPGFFGASLSMRSTASSLNRITRDSIGPAAMSIKRASSSGFMSSINASVSCQGRESSPAWASSTASITASAPHQSFSCLVRRYVSHVRAIFATSGSSAGRGPSLCTGRDRLHNVACTRPLSRRGHFLGVSGIVQAASRFRALCSPAGDVPRPTSSASSVTVVLPPAFRSVMRSNDSATVCSFV
jgi:hypothetical protein